jgi:hypothetical protein
LPKQVNSLYLAGCTLTHFWRKPLRVGRKAAHTLENLGRESTGV